MKFGGTKNYWAVIVVFLILLWSSIGQTQKQPDCPNGRGGGNPSWFNPGKNCNRKEKPYHYDAAGGIYINQEQRRCKEVILICGTMMVRESVVNKDPGCGGAFWPDSKDGDEVCCEEFQKAVQSKQPCDPSKDADCDGVLNENDSNPFKADPPDPDADHKCYQLELDVYNAYLTAGADKLGTALPASRNARYDCLKRIEKEKCPTIAWEPHNDYHGPVKYPQDPDPDHKCAQLGQDVYQAYLKAGAKDDTASNAGGTAREECRKSRASKLRS